VRHDPGAREPLQAVHLTAHLPHGTLTSHDPSTSGPQLLTGSWDGKWHTWESWPKVPRRAEEFARGEKGVGHENLVTGIALSRDGKKLAVGCTVGRVLVFQGDCPVTEVVVHDREELTEFKEALKLGDYGEFYLKYDVMLAGTQLEQWDQLLTEKSFEGKSSRRDVDKVDLPATFRFRFTGCLTKGHKKAWRSLEHNGAVRCMAISAEGSEEFLYSGSRDRLVKKWSLATGALVHDYEGHTSTVRCLAVNSDYLVSGGDDRKLRVWDKAAPTLLRTIAGHSDFIRAVALCPNLTNRLVSSADDGKVILWDAGTGQQLLEYEQKGLATDLLLNASLLITAGEDSRLRVWRTESAELLHGAKHPGAVTAISWL